MRLFLTDRTQQIAYSSQLSVGVPQWSVLGPLLYLLCTDESDLVVSRHGPNMHHADGTPVSISAMDAEAAVGCLTACLVDIETWLKASHLRLNHAKTQVMWLGSNSAAAGQSRHLRSSSRHVSTSQRRRVTLYSRHWQSAVPDVCKVVTVCRSGNYQLLQLRPLIVSMSTEVVWCQALDGTTTSCQCYRSCTQCTGFRFHIGWLWGSPPWSTCHCPAHLAADCQLARLRRRSSSTEFYRIKDVCCQQSDGRPTAIIFFSCRSETVEQHSTWSATRWH